jgi:hypothetical protein
MHLRASFNFVGLAVLLKNVNLPANEDLRPPANILPASHPLKKLKSAFGTKLEYGSMKNIIYELILNLRFCNPIIDWPMG